jgi:hypothetical protein
LRRDQNINKVEKREKPASRKVEKGKLKQTRGSFFLFWCGGSPELDLTVNTFSAKTCKKNWT